MALVKPTAKTKAAFDATKSETFYFSVDGGDLVTKNRITIVDQATGNNVYQHTTEEGHYIYNQEVYTFWYILGISVHFLDIHYSLCGDYV